MLDASSILLSTVFSALADPARRTILERLTRGSATAGELAEPLDMSLPAVSKHLKIMERAGLISRKIAGRQHIFTVIGHPIDEALEWLNRHRRFWSDSFDRLEDYLKETS